MDLHNNLLSFNYWHHKFILLIGINDLMLMFHKKNFFSTIFKIKVHLSVETSTDSHNNCLSFDDWAPKIHSLRWDTRIDALVS